MEVPLSRGAYAPVPQVAEYEVEGKMSGPDLPSPGTNGKARSTLAYKRKDMTNDGAGLSSTNSTHWTTTSALPEGVDEHTFIRHVMSGRVMDALMMKEKGTCCVEVGSVYGAALVFPQIARTSGWSVHYSALAVRSWTFLFANIFIQGFLLFMICKEERVNDRFAGVMHLCNMGAGLPKCPGSPDCIGPRGSTYTPERLYSWDAWIARVFVKDSLMAMFPDRVNDIDELVDPGEYGLESYWLRLTCCLLFIMGVWPDVVGTWDLLYMIYQVPSSDDPWVAYEPTGEDHQLRGELDINFAKFRIAGMPMHWKVLNLLFVVLPKLYIWLLLVELGTLFLMETAGLESMIMNTVALAFVLSIDELICATLFTDKAKYMLDNLEPLPLFEADILESDHETWDRHQLNRQWHIFTPKMIDLAFPKRLFGIVLVTGFFQVKYYVEHCQQQADGSWVSTDLYLPLQDTLSIWAFLFGPIPGVAPVATSDEILWSANDINRSREW